MKKNTTKNLCFCAMFAALTAVFSQIQIPLAQVPINLATLSVMLAGGLLGWKYGAVSQLVYVLLGTIGAPVFAGFSGGFGIVMGKTGGYIVGYVFCALIIGLMTDKVKVAKKVILPVSMVVGTIALYAFGTGWFMIVTGSTLWQSLIWCVFPFLIGDAAKIVIATVLSLSLKPILYRTANAG